MIVMITSLCDNFEVENETLHDYSNEEELASDDESENDYKI